jgi:predicted ATPase/class 3 adenylate cyclase
MAEDPGPAITATEAAIAALEAQRSALGDAVADAALAPLRERLQTLRATPRRRQATVLFLDIVGSTALGQRLDPEELHAALDGLLAEATQQVVAHGGRVLQYAGDNLLATFGGEASSNTDGEGAAEHAVRCALALCRQGRAFGERMQAQHGHAGCNVRVGLHTGPVLLGAGVDEAHSIRGFAVHLAARMEQSAPPGSVRISHDTWLLVRGRFSTEAQPPLLVKGHTEALRTHLVLAELPAGRFDTPSRGVEGVQAPLIGRDTQQRLLAEHLATALVQRRPQAVTLVGEPGVGKSRLLQEWRAALGTGGHRLLLARAQPALRQQPFGLLRALVLGHLGIADSDDAATACARFEAAVVPALGGGELAPVHAHALGQLLALPFGDSPHVRGLEPPVLRRVGLQSLRRWLHAQAPTGAALVLLLEDLHWADDDSLDTLAALLAAPEPVALLLASSARPELRSHRPGWPEAAPQHAWVPLAELDAADRARLADALLAPLQSADSGLRALLAERSDGNPFFMEELLRMLLDHGVVVPEAEGWRVQPERLQQARLPTTLVEVLQARLDALQPAERRALQQASIVGPVFWQGTLAAIDPQAPAAVPALRDKGLLDEREPSAFEDTPESAFHHHVMQQVAYDSVLRAARRQGHAAVARWLADRAGDRAGEHLAITAQHFEQAGELDTAREWYRRAGVDAFERGSHRTALAHVEAALRCTAPEDLRKRFTLHQNACNAADALGLRDRQRAELDTCAQLAAQLDDPALRSRNLFNRALLASRLGREAEALALAEEAARLSANGVEPEISAQAQAQMAWSQFTQGRQAEALALADIAVAEARQYLAAHWNRFLEGQLGKVLTVRAIVLKAGGDYARARADLAEALPLTQGAGLRRLQLSISETTAGIDADIGALESALGHYRRTLALSLSIGDRLFAVGTSHNVAYTLWQMGRTAEAEQAWAGLIDEARACGAQETVGRLQMLACSLALDGGRPDEAEAQAAAAVATFEALASPAFLCVAQSRLALTALARGDMAAATQRAETVWQALDSGLGLAPTDAPQLPPLACHRVFQRAGDARATEALRRAHAQVQEIAALIGDPATREQVLNHPHLNREIVQAWAAHSGGAASG